MAIFKIIEETFAYKEYDIEANSFEEAKQKWEDNDEDIEWACNHTEWEISDMIELHSIEDEKGNVEFYT